MTTETTEDYESCKSCAMGSMALSSIKSIVPIQEKLLKEGYRAPVDKSKWVSRNDFKGWIGKMTTGNGFDSQPNHMTYVGRDPSEPPKLFQFRYENPD